MLCLRPSIRFPNVYLVLQILGFYEDNVFIYENVVDIIRIDSAWQIRLKVGQTRLVGWMVKANFYLALKWCNM